ncbi:MAG: DUF1829 domain-containing protein [Planctomycetaceae bacterium]|nr:MAG: DUF1829 domain-containing protein [Planctomycetaceae bacterium]
MTATKKSSLLVKELQGGIDDYFAWLRDRTTLKEIKGDKDYVEITTPHLDRHNDCIQFYARQDGAGGYVLTDDGAVISDLEMSGCKLTSPKRQELLRLTLNGFGVECDDKALVVRATPQTFARKKHDLIQAMLAVNDMFALAGPTVNSLFIEDVSAWLEQNEVRYVPRIRMTGQSGYDHTFDFVIAKFRDEPERIVQAISQPSKSTAEALVFKWIDTRGARDKNSQAYAVLNDQEHSVPEGVLEALDSYNIHAVPWSVRADVVEKLAV